MTKIRVICFIAFIIVLSSCRRGNIIIEDVIESDYTDEAYAWADSILGSMTEEERIGQLLMPAVMSVADEITIDKIDKYVANQHIGGLLLLGGNMQSAEEICSYVKEITSVTPLLAIDAEWGLAMRFPEAEEFPKNNLLSEKDEQYMYDYGNEIAHQCRQLGINMVLGPVLDVARPKSYISYRSFGSDADKVASLGVAYAKGLEDGRVISVAKHFPGHGSTKADSHKTLPLVELDSLALDSIDLKPFKSYIQSALSGIMIGHLSVPALDKSGASTSVSKAIIHKLLRNKIGFEGLIISDALNMEGASGISALEAIKAGADIVIAPANTSESYNEILNAVKSRNLSINVVNDRCRRILFHKYRLTKLGEGEGFKN